MIQKKNNPRVRTCMLLLGCPWGQCPIKKQILSMSKETKWWMELPEGFACPIPSFNEANFCGEETGHSKSCGEQIWKLIWNKQKIIAWSKRPYIYDKWLSKYSIQWCCLPVWELQKQCPLTDPQKKIWLVAILSQHVKGLSSIYRFPHQILTYSLG